jgi:hypothetical protein
MILQNHFRIPALRSAKIGSRVLGPKFFSNLLVHLFAIDDSAEQPCRSTPALFVVDVPPARRLLHALV